MPNRGIFWFVKTDYDDEYHILYKSIPTGEHIEGNSRLGDNYTHKETWAEVSADQPRDIRKKKWNHFPRGRVEQKKDHFVIYLNPALNQEPYREAIIEAFDLQTETCVFDSDGSKHYQSGID